MSDRVTIHLGDDEQSEIGLTSLRKSSGAHTNGVSAKPAGADRVTPSAEKKSVDPFGVKSPTVERIYKAHQTANAQYLRDAILGVNDGLVSMFLLTLGLVGGGQDSIAVLLAGVTGALAGAISMALGEYIATKSQAQVTRSELELEREHLVYHREKELTEVRSFMQELSLEGELLDRVVNTIGTNDEAILRLMMAFEFGFQEELERNPLKAMMTSGALFLTGSLPSVIPYACTNNVHDALYASIAFAAAFLFFIGAIKTRTTKGPWLYDGMENLVLGAVGGAITYGLGAAYNTRGSS